MKEKISADGNTIEYIYSEEEKAEHEKQFNEERRRVARRPLIGVIRDAYWGYGFEETQKVLKGTLLANLAGIKDSYPKPKFWSKDWSDGGVSVWQGKITYFGPDNQMRTEKLFDEDFVQIADYKTDKIYVPLDEFYRMSIHDHGFRAMFKKELVGNLADLFLGRKPHLGHVPEEWMKIELMEQVLVEAKDQIEKGEMTKRGYQRVSENLESGTLWANIHSEIINTVANEKMRYHLTVPHFVYGHVPWLRY